MKPLTFGTPDEGAQSMKYLAEEILQSNLVITNISIKSEPRTAGSRKVIIDLVEMNEYLASIRE